MVAAVFDDAEKSFVGIDDPTVKIPDEDADDVGINQPRFEAQQLSVSEVPLSYQNLLRTPAT